MKTHKKTRIILIIIAALVAICSSIAIITTTANKNNANAASIGSSVVATSSGIGNAGSGNKEDDFWWAGDADASANGIEDVFNETYKQIHNWPISWYPNPSTNQVGWGIHKSWQPLIDAAIQNCKDRDSDRGGKGECEGARLVALGWPQFSGSKGGNFSGNCDLMNKFNNNKISCPDGGAGSLSYPPNNFCMNTISVQGTNIGLNNIIGDKTSICGAIHGLDLGNGKAKMAAVVLSKDEYQQSGWIPTFKPVDTYAYTSRIKISSQKLTPCPYEYTMQTVGVDGYVKNYATTQHTYKTAYGKFLDDVANGKYNGSYYYVDSGKKADFSNSPQEYQNNDLINDYNQSCQEAWNEVDNYNIESEAKSSKEVDDTTKKTIISGKEFLQRYAKGGIYKVIRGRLDGNINYRTTDVKYYKTKASYYIFDDWVSCKKTDNPTTDPDGKQISCGYIGKKDKPSDKDNPYLGKKYKITHEGWGDPLPAQDGWAFYDDHPSPIVENEYHSVVSGQDNVFLYDSGYYDENGQLHEKDNLIAKTPQEWNDYFYEFEYGFEGDDISPRLHPVKQEYKSWNHVWHQDFMNILCDKTDFDNYKTALDKMYGDYIYTDISKVANGSKYQGQLKSPVIDSAFANDHNYYEVDKTWHKNGKQDGMKDPNTDNWYSNSGVDMWFYKWDIAASQVAATMEPFDRVLYTVSTPLTTDNNLDMANAFKNINSVVGDTSADTLLTKAKSVNSAYNTDNFIRWYNSAAYDASLDPVYTKECPYDCTDDAGGTASSSNDNVVNGRTEDGASPSTIGLKKKSDDRATGGDNDNDYGVRVRTTDSKGNLKPSTEDVNTANMTFFRNNTWNRFRVDIWYPIFKDGLTAASASDSIRGISETKGSQTAKSTTIIRKDGTPWYIKGTDPNSGFATEMKVIKSLDNGDSIDGSNARLFNETTDIIPGNQISLDSVTAHGAHVVELPYEATAFAIRSMWATDPNIGKLEFNIKWEFDSKNNLDVPTKFTVGNTADSVSSTSTPQYAISDGKCYGNQNKGQSYNYDLINLFHDNTGAGTIDNLDKEFNDNFGKFTIQFVRSTAE